MKRSQTLIFGHRGASSDAPENSLEAFARARADGADGVELDVRLCGSGEVIVFHDADLCRLGGQQERVADLPLWALQARPLISGASIPTLKEVFEACGPDMLVNVEIKADGLIRLELKRLLAAVARVLAQVSRPERVILSSFNPLAVLGASRVMPNIMRGLLFEAEGPLWARAQAVAPWLPIQAVHPQDKLCTPQSVARWKAHGYAINVWTVDDPERQHALVRMGVDGIITNKPGAARKLMDELRAAPAINSP